MPPIIVLIARARDRLTLEAALAAVGPVRACGRADALAALAAGVGARLVVSELRDGVGSSVVPVLAELACRASAPAVLALASLTDPGAADVLALAATRTPVQLVLRGVDDLAAAARAALSGRYDMEAALPILERVGPLVPRSLGGWFVLAAARASPWLKLARAATLLGVGRRTIEGRLARAAFPPAHRVIGWCAALRACWRLDVLGQRPKQVALALGFASHAALGNLLARYCGCSATALRDHGGFAGMRERFAAELDRPVS